MGIGGGMSLPKYRTGLSACAFAGVEKRGSSEESAPQ